MPFIFLLNSSALYVTKKVVSSLSLLPFCFTHTIAMPHMALLLYVPYIISTLYFT